MTLRTKSQWIRRVMAAAAASASLSIAGATFAHQLGSMPAGPATKEVPEDVKPVVRGGRFCEIMIVRKVDGKNKAEVWSTQGISACPEDCEAAFNARDIKSETKARRVVINGPKVWLPNLPAPTPPTDARRSFGGIEVGLVVTIEVKRGAGDPFKERVVPRKTTNTFMGGEEVYELVSPDGDVYVMQSMSLSEDPKLTMDDLATLDERMRLPRGWKYRARVLQEDLHLGSTLSGEVTVLQDRLKNTYQRR